MSDLVDYQGGIEGLQPLGLPAKFNISLTVRPTHYTNNIFVYLRDVDGNQLAVETVSISTDSNLTFERRIAKIRDAAVKMFNQYVTNLGDADILKSIEDRLNANREMLVLESRPGPAVDDGPAKLYGADDFRRMFRQ